MPYVLRDKNGKIESFHKDPPSPGAELVCYENEQEVISFLRDTGSISELQEVFLSSDLSLIRVLEDVVHLLCKNHTIVFTDLPEAAQMKLSGRKNFRSGMGDIERLISEEEDGIF